MDQKVRFGLRGMTSSGKGAGKEGEGKEEGVAVKVHERKRVPR
jgi:hypothetical protein